MTRRCNMCHEDKAPEEFHRCKRDPIMGRQWQCRSCNSARNVAAYGRVRSEIIEFLGGGCACCDEREAVFLQVDHVNGGGGVLRKKNSGVHMLARQVRTSPEEFQLLCGNCHSAKTVGVTCPHQVRVGGKR